MPKNTTGGNKAKKGKNSGQRVERPLILADNSGDQRYGIVEAFGGSTATVKFIRPIKSPVATTAVQTETITAVGFIRNSLRKWCKRFLRGDIILICERDFETGKVDIVHKYNDDELRALKRLPQEYSKIQPLVDAYSLKMEKNKSSVKTNDADGGEEIQFDEDFNGSESEEESEDEDSANQAMSEMNEEYAEERSGGYKSLSGRQRADNPKYAKSVAAAGRSQQPKKQTGGRPIAPQQGTRELPPSDSEDESADELAHI